MKRLFVQRFRPTILFTALVLAVGLLLPSAAYAQERVCSGSVVSQLQVGGIAQVTPGPANGIWSNWIGAKHRIGVMEAGVTMDVLEGPECRVGITWWKVRSHKDGVEGWTGEGRGNSYWLTPVEQPACSTADGQPSADALRAFVIAELGVDPAAHENFDLVADVADTPEPTWYVHSQGDIFNGDPIPSHFLAAYTFDASTCGWVQIDRVEIQDDNGVELPEMSSVEVQVADGEPYFLSSINYLPGGAYQLYRLRNGELSMVDQGGAGRRGVFELHRWGLERLAVLTFDPGAGGPIPEGTVSSLHMSVQVDIGGDFQPLLNVELNGHLFAYRESIPQGSNPPLLVVGFWEEAHSPWNLHVTVVNERGTTLATMVEFAYIPVGDGMQMMPVNRAVWRYDTSRGETSTEQVITPPTGLVYCSEIEQVLEQLTRGDSPAIEFLMRDPDGSTMPVPDAAGYWLWLNSNETGNTGWAIRTEDVLLSCPGLSDLHTGEPIIPPTGEGSVLMLLPAKTDTSANPDLTVDIVAPRFELIPLPAGIDGFNELVDGFVAAQVAELEDMLADWTPVDGQGSSLWVDYRLIGVSPRMISVLLRRNHYLSGTAHPAGAAHVAINYDLEADRQLALSELFLPGSDYLTELVTLAESELTYLEFPTNPLTAEETTFQNWNIGPGGLLISFDTYQIAPYAAGPIQVTISFGALEGLLDPAGPAAEFYPSLGG